MNGTGLKLLFLLVALFGLSACETTEQRTQTALALTPEHFKSTAILVEDDSGGTALISTKSGFQQKQGLLRMVYDDNFLRAIIDKKTGNVTYQVYQSIYYQASAWRFYRKANYETPDGPESIDAKFLRPPLALNFDCPDHTSSACTYNENVGFSVDRDLLDRIASTYEPEKS
ncbi:MAG: hypothetical protein MKZ70_00195, partial [Opitutales bacterium]|nr:hypothetical protein [Opitutales bacterium]